MKFDQIPVSIRAEDVEKASVTLYLENASKRVECAARQIAGLLRVLANNIEGHGLPVDGEIELVNMFGKPLGTFAVDLKEGVDYRVGYRVAMSAGDIGESK